MLVIDNKTIQIYNIKDLLKINPIIPDFQRLIDKNKVKEIISYQIDYRKQHQKTNFLGLSSFAMIPKSIEEV